MSRRPERAWIVALGAIALVHVPVLSVAKDGEWPMAALDYASTRYSPLDQIDASNVRNLEVEFTFSTSRACSSRRS